jgi:hypothetical protein
MICRKPSTISVPYAPRTFLTLYHHPENKGAHRLYNATEMPKATAFFATANPRDSEDGFTRARHAVPPHLRALWVLCGEVLVYSWRRPPMTEWLRKEINIP